MFWYRIVNKKILLLFQREARGSVTFKIVPSYRSAPPPCEVQVSPKIRDHSPTLTTSVITTITTTASTSTSIETNYSSASNQKSMKPVPGSSKEKPGKSQKPGKTKSTSDSTPRRRLVNPLSVLRSRKSHT